MLLLNFEAKCQIKIIANRRNGKVSRLKTFQILKENVSLPNLAKLDHSLSF